MKDIKLKKIQPMFSKILLTADVYEDDKSKLIDSVEKLNNPLKFYQKVVAVGPIALLNRDGGHLVKEGDIVKLNYTMYGTPVQKKSANTAAAQQEDWHVEMKYNIPSVMVDGQQYLLVEDRCVEYVVEEYEEIPDIIVAKQKIIH